MTRLTFKQVAMLMVKVFKIDHDELPFIQGRLKNFNAKLGILHTKDSDDLRGTRVLDEIGAVEAVLFSELVDIGFDAQLLREVREYFDRFPQKMKLIVNPQLFRDMDAPRFEIKLYRSDNPQVRRRFFLHTVDGEKSRVSETLENFELQDKRLATVLTVDLKVLLSDFLFEFGQVGLFGERYWDEVY